MNTDRKVIVLGAALLATAGFGLRSLLFTAGGPTETGFDGGDPFSLVATVVPATPTDFRPPVEPRNPFATRGDATVEEDAGGANPLDATDAGDDADGGGLDNGGTSSPTTSASAPEQTPITAPPFDESDPDLAPVEPLTEADLVRQDDPPAEGEAGDPDSGDSRDR